MLTDLTLESTLGITLRDISDLLFKIYFTVDPGVSITRNARDHPLPNVIASVYRYYPGGGLLSTSDVEPLVARHGVRLISRRFNDVFGRLGQLQPEDVVSLHSPIFTVFMASKPTARQLVLDGVHVPLAKMAWQLLGSVEGSERMLFPRTALTMLARYAEVSRK